MARGGRRPGAGRPSTYREEYCEQVIELGKQGKSQAQMAAALHVPRSTLQGWMEQHEAFGKAMAFAKDLEQAWWEEAGQNGTVGTLIHPQTWKTSVTHRFRGEYTETQNINIGAQDSLSELMTEISTRGNRIGVGRDDD